MPTASSELTQAEHPEPRPRAGSAGVQGWVDPTWRPAPEVLLGDPAEALAALWSLEPERFLRQVPRRETLVWTPPGYAGTLVVKRLAGDLTRDLWYERLRWRERASPARREARNLRGLTLSGFAVPRALAWFEQLTSGAGEGTSGRLSALVMQYVDHSEHLRERLESGVLGEEERARLDHLAAEVARLHLAGWYHRDLYLEHVILTGSEPRDMVLLDAGRARRERSPRERWFVKDVAALLHSAPEVVPAHARLRFLSRYMDERGLLDAGARRAFQRSVERKAASLAAHDPRFVDLGGSRAVRR